MCFAYSECCSLHSRWSGWLRGQERRITWLPASMIFASSELSDSDWPKSLTSYPNSEALRNYIYYILSWIFSSLFFFGLAISHVVLLCHFSNRLGDTARAASHHWRWHLQASKTPTSVSAAGDSKTGNASANPAGIFEFECRRHPCELSYASWLN